jgi:hypothetical protein
MGGLKSAPCIGIVASRIAPRDAPPNSDGSEGGRRLLIPWAPSSKRGGPLKILGPLWSLGLGEVTPLLSQDGV